MLTIDAPFLHGGAIDERFSIDGDDVSPALTFSNVPAGTRELVLIVHDPDAPLLDGFTHWVISGIPGDVTGIAEGAGGAYVEGVNDFGNRGYGGPAPPPGHGLHHYFFHLYALDTPLDLPAGLSREEVLDAIEEHILEQARVVGTFSR